MSIRLTFKSNSIDYVQTARNYVVGRTCSTFIHSSFIMKDAKIVGRGGSPFSSSERANSRLDDFSETQTRES